MTNYRGFTDLIGETVKNVITTTINEVIIETESGKRFSVEGEIGPFGIPTLVMSVLKD